MGDARRNVASAQYRGQLPQAVFSASVEVSIQPSKKWMAEHPPNDDIGQQIAGEADCEVVLDVSAIYSVPLATVAQAEWPGFMKPAGQMRLPLLNFKMLAKRAFEKDHPQIAAMITFDDAPEDETNLIVP